MDREDAIEYLQEKGRIRDVETVQPEFTEEEETEIGRVEKKGKMGRYDKIKKALADVDRINKELMELKELKSEKIFVPKQHKILLTLILIAVIIDIIVHVII